MSRGSKEAVERMNESNGQPPTMPFALPDVRVPVAWTLGGLVAGLALGMVLAGTALAEPIAGVAAPLGRLWLRALQMTIIPLVAGLLVTGIGEAVAAARAGAMAARTLGAFAVLLAAGTVASALLMPALLDAFPLPESAAAALRRAVPEGAGAVPQAAAFIEALVPSNVFTAAASDAILPVIVFVALLGVAITRLPPAPRAQLSGLFAALAGAMLIVIGWVLRLAPLGVLCLAFGVGANSGTAAIGALAHYIALVASMGGIVLLAAYAVAMIGARRKPATFAREMLPVQAVALSTQSSLASLPAMLGACNRLGVARASAEFVLPLAVALFRATGPGMNLAVCIYVAKLSGVALTPEVLAAGIAMALLTTVGTVSLPGTISFVSAIGPIALAMGLPLEPLALLVAVEMLPDIVRTVGNVTMDVAVAATIDRRRFHVQGNGL
ncbi:MAG: cation:dicarboxylase symporter family transporter [Novosphingobium sp.]